MVHGPAIRFGGAGVSREESCNSDSTLSWDSIFIGFGDVPQA